MLLGPVTRSFGRVFSPPLQRTEADTTGGPMAALNTSSAPIECYDHETIIDRQKQGAGRCLRDLYGRPVECLRRLLLSIP